MVIVYDEVYGHKLASLWASFMGDIVEALRKEYRNRLGDLLLGQQLCCSPKF